MEFGVYKAKENAPDHIVKVLSVLEDIIRGFNVTVNVQRDLTMIRIQDIKTKVQGDHLRIILLNIFTNPKSYLMNLYHQTSGNKNQDLVYEIKVKGDYELKTLKKNLVKLIRGKNLTYHPRFYPF